MYTDEQIELLLNVEPEQAIELQQTGWDGRHIRKQLKLKGVSDT
jgi:hypothetical protein